MNYPILPKENVPIDAHCHFFNKEVLSLHLLVQLLMVGKSPKNQQEYSISAAHKGAVSKALSFLKVALSSVPSVYATLEKDESGFAFCPLMFDLDSCVNNVNSTDSTASVMEHWRDELEVGVQELIALAEDFQEKEALEELWELVTENTTASNRKSGLEAQEDQLTGLVKNFPNRIFPFFVIDPRRFDFCDKEILKSVTNRFRMNGGIFSGVKMYAPCGYSPCDERLFPLYAYCQENSIPITAHCSGSGFASFASTINVQGLIYLNGKVVEHHGPLYFEHFKLRDKNRVEEKAIKLNHPKLWAEVLKKYPRLKLNLAHFGLHDSGDWSKEIFAMMQIYPNLYTDFSCVCNSSSLRELYENYYKNATSDVKKRFLYGSDYYLNLLFIDSIPDYIKHFHEIFTEKEWNEITRINPRGFLDGKKERDWRLFERMFGKG